jgi:hypothetical protein
MSTKRSAARPDIATKLATKRFKVGGILHGDVLANILSYLPWREVLKCRMVSPEWRDAVLSTPVQEIVVDTLDLAHELPSLAVVMPGLQKLKLLSPLDYNDTFIVDDEVLSLARGFRQLTSLEMGKTTLRTCAPRIMHLHNLETLDLGWNERLVWDLADLSAIPRLKNLLCIFNIELTGDLIILQALSRTLVALNLLGCKRIVGNLQTLVSFPRLEKLNVYGTKVTGDVRKIGSPDFPCLKKIRLGEHVYGGSTVNRIVDAPEVMEAWHRFEIRNPGIWTRQNCPKFALEAPERQRYLPSFAAVPFSLEMIRCGPRYGWRWTNRIKKGHCEIHWFDVEPRPDDNGYDLYVRDLAAVMNGIPAFYRGLLVPPSPEEYHRIHSEWHGEDGGVGA